MPDQVVLLGREAGEFVVNSVTAGEQSNPRIAKLASGGFVVVWNGAGAKAQLYDATGARLGGEIELFATASPAAYQPTVAALASGGFVVVAADSNAPEGARAQIFSATGVKVGGEISDMPGTDFGWRFETAGLPGGGFVIVRETGLGQVYDAAGAPVGASFLVGAAGQSAPVAVATLANGNFAVAVAKTDGGSFVQIFDQNGGKIGSEISTTGHRAHDSTSFRMAALEGGGFVLAWDGTPVVDRDVIAQVFASDGSRVGGEIFLASGIWAQAAPNVTGVAGGGFLATWTSMASYTGPTQVFGQLFSAAGTTVGTEFLVSTESSGPLPGRGHALAAVGGDRFVAVWHGGGPGDELADEESGGGIRGHILKALGALTPDIESSADSIIETHVGNTPALGFSARSAAINATYTYELLSESTGGGFTLDGTRLIVADNRLLDHETAPAASVTVRVTDIAGNVAVETFALAIADAAIELRYVGGPESSVFATHLAALPGGGFVTTGARGTADNGEMVGLQRYDAQGSRIGDETVVATVNMFGDVRDSRVTPLASGGFAVAWEERSGAGGSSLEIKVQVFDAAGSAVGAPVQANTITTGTQWQPAIAGLSGGGFVAAWQDEFGDTNGSAVRAQVFDASGSKIGTEILINTAIVRNQRNPEVAGLPDGGFIAVWTDFSGEGSDTSSAGVKAQRFDSIGNKLGAEFLVNSTTLGSQSLPAVAVDSAGNVLVGWHNQQTGLADIRAQLLDSNGNKVGGEIVLASGFQQELSIAARPGGGFFVSWAMESPLDGSSHGVFGQLLDGSGAKNGAAFLINQATAFSQSSPDVAVLADGTLAAIWAGVGSTRLRLFSDADRIARDDRFATGETGIVTGSLFADNGSGADSGAGLQIAAVNGSAAAVGNQITLASGARVTVTADGRISYDPSGAYDYLAPPGSGAANMEAVETFTYALAGGTTARVTITITGSLSAGDRYLGSSADDLITGTEQANIFFVDQGGTDQVWGLGGNDIFFFGGALGSLDRVDGGPGNDTLVLQGNYGSLVLDGASLVGIEGVSLQSGTITRWGHRGDTWHIYNLTMANANVEPGLQLRVNGQSLTSWENFTFNGSAETDGGRFLVYAGFGTDLLTGGSGNDIFFFEAGRLGSKDRIAGGTGNDAVVISGAPDGTTGPVQLTIAAGTLTSIESLSFNGRFASDPSGRPSYSAVMENGNIAAGGTLIVNGSSLGADQSLSFDGSAVADARLRIFGGAGGDALTGGWGDDVIEGGAGGDALTSGLGRDVFIYRSLGDSFGVTCDLITDFHFGHDRIDLSLIDADITADGDQAFRFIGSEGFSGKAGELRVVFQGGVNAWALQGDVNGDGVTDFQLYVSTGAGPPPEADLIL
jgi:Ca2+-binding RTX toxin-like protein